METIIKIHEDGEMIIYLKEIPSFTSAVTLNVVMSKICKNIP